MSSAVQSTPMSTEPVIPISSAPTTELGPASEPVIPTSRPVTREEIAAWLITGGLLLFVLLRHLVPALIVGLTLYLILDRVSLLISGRLSRSTVRPLALLIVTLVTAAVMTGAVALIAMMLRRGAGTLPAMMDQMADILASVRLWLGGLGQQAIPEVMTDAEDLKAMVVNWLKTHAQTFRAGGVWLGIGLIYMIMGAAVAILVFFRHVTHHDYAKHGPLAGYLGEKIASFADAFAKIAIAQIKISAVNTTLTALYLLVALPLFGIHIPFATTLVLVTFICGLIPVLGNLISNTVITILSMGVSIGTAVASLTFLIVIHKLEYFINSRIVGGETDSQAWEILAAIIVGEAAFGLGGVVMAPIIYAFMKHELRERRLI